MGCHVERSETSLVFYTVELDSKLIRDSLLRSE